MKKLAISVIAIWGAAAIAIFYFLPTWENRGQFGDLFGAVNALFSGLAFAGLYSALKMQQTQLDLQRKELQLQHEELRLQREEMKASRSELANQVQAQHALVRASTAQIAVAACQARIEAVKIDSTPSVIGLNKQNFVDEINTIAKEMESLSKKIENENGIAQS